MRNLLAMLLLSALPAAAEVASFSPQAPRWGQTVTVRYDPSAEGAVLTAIDPIHVVAWIYGADGVVTVWKAMTLGDDGTFTAAFPLEEGAAYLRFNFVTRSDWDPNTGLETMVHDAAGEPAPGAFRHAMTPTHAEESFRAEIERHPDQYAAYRDYWFLSRAAGKQIDERLRADLEQLERIEGERPASLLYALSCGRMMVGDEPAGRRWLLEAIERFPNADFTEQAHRCYQYQVFARQIALDDPQRIPSRIRELAAAYPASPLVREQAWSLAHEEATPLETIEKVHAAWIADQADHPMAWFVLSLALDKHREDPERGAAAAAKAADLILDGKYRFYEDVGGKATERLLPEVYLTQGRNLRRAGRFGSALASLRVAQQLDERPAEAYREEAGLWQELGDWERAEQVLARAWRHDPVKVGPELKAFYRFRRGSDEGFDGWLAAQTEPAGGDEKGGERAPDFEVTTLDGERVKMSELRGKVVVVNFWFAGCAPCIVEMPALNRLVERFADRPVVFLAPALDSREVLGRFLKQHGFRYRVVPDAGDLHETFGVTSYPTHVLVDKDGSIRHRLSGGSAEADEELAPLIEQLIP